MKKDILIALITGAFIGCSAALLFTHLPDILNRTLKTPQIGPSPSEEIPSSKLIQTTPLDILLPADNVIADAKKIQISGKTLIDNFVIMESDTDALSLVASGDGTFKFPVTLTEGVNRIYITSYANSGESNSKSLNIFYTEEKI